MGAAAAPQEPGAADGEEETRWWRLMLPTRRKVSVKEDRLYTLKSGEECVPGYLLS